MTDDETQAAIERDAVALAELIFDIYRYNKRKEALDDVLYND